MLPEVQEYFDAINSYPNTRHIDAAHPVPSWDHTMSPDQVEAYFEAETTREAALREVATAHKRRQAEAYQKLVASEDPLVRWLVTDPAVRRYGYEADTVLKALPMSREEMEKFGKRQGWCEVYGDLLERAEAAGVLPAPTPHTAVGYEAERERQGQQDLPATT
ncbi:hypothetical protein [Nonomuraea wenchangensis]|uniref:hypothetical protein n=1 Tax=Nonomuraea wenchangensis TaxID=568860 RepID=UPI00331A3214